MKRILILGGKNYSNKRILQELRNLGVKSQIAPVRNFTINTSSEKGDDRIYHKNDRVFYNHLDAIIPRIGKHFAFGVSVVRHIAINNGCYTTSKSEGLINASDKQKCIQILSKARLRTPSTTYFEKCTDYKFMTDTVGGLPCVAKLIKGSQGKGVFILTDQLGGSTALKTIMLSKKVLIQQYLESSKDGEKKSDIRAWVVGDEVVASMKRYSVKKDFRSNYSISHDAEKVVLTSEEKKLAVDAAKAIGLSLCGVDLMRDKLTNQTYVIECNGNASLYGIEKVTKVNVAKHIAEFVKKNADVKIELEDGTTQMQALLKVLKSKGSQYNVKDGDFVDGVPFLSEPTQTEIDNTLDHEEMAEFGVSNTPSYVSMSKAKFNNSRGFQSSYKNGQLAAQEWIEENEL